MCREPNKKFPIQEFEEEVAKSLTNFFLDIMDESFTSLNETKATYIAEISEAATHILLDGDL